MRASLVLIFVSLKVIILLAQDNLPRLVLPIGHTQQIGYAEFSPDNKYVVTASHDNTVKLWEVNSGKLLNSWDGYEDPVTSAKFSPDGSLIATASRAVKVWDFRTGKLAYSLPDAIPFWSFVQFSPDGKLISTISTDNSVRLWNSITGQQLHVLAGHKEEVNDHQFSPDGRTILTTSKEAAKIWDISSGKELLSMEGASGAKYSPDGKTFLTYIDKVATIRKSDSGQPLFALKGHTQYISSAEFSPDGKRIMTSSGDATARVWDATTGRLIFTLTGHTEKLSGAHFSMDGKLIVTRAEFETDVKIWDALTGKLRYTLTGHIEFMNAAEFSDNSQYIVTSSSDLTAKIWDSKNGLLIHTLEGHTQWSTCASFNRDDNFVVAANTIWNLNTGAGNFLERVSTKDYLLDIQISPDSKRILSKSLSDNNSADMWEAPSGRFLFSLVGHTGVLVRARFSSDGKYVITSSHDKTAMIWDAQTGKLLFSVPGHSNMLIGAEFSPDGRFIGTTSWDNTCHVWDFINGKFLFELKEHSAPVWGVRFSSNGKHLVTAAHDKTQKIWETESGKLLFSIEGYSDTNLAEFSPDGNFIASRVHDSGVKIWETQTGKIVREFNEHTGRISVVKFSPDGKHLLTTADDKSIKVWDIQAAKVLKDFYTPGELSDVNHSWNRASFINGSRLYLYDLTTTKELLSWIRVDSLDWVVTHPSGLFDASPGAMVQLHFVQGLDIIEFNQLKERYYEPGLWKKVMAGEQLRNVVGMKSIDLPPDIQVGQVDQQGYLNIKLTNRGGGIGEVNVFVNGKEVIKDARDATIKPDAAIASLKVFVGKHKSIVKGQENMIAVKAWNKDHWVQSRGQVVSYHSKEIEQYKPAVHILTCGVSDYTGNEIDLKYAAKDANDVSVALQLGAKKLFGAERSYVYNLTTAQAKEFYPTKTNILKVFEKISSTAHPLDIFVMYVSGHGINYGGQDGDWHYLTQEAYTGSASAYNDPAIRAQTTISSAELVELFKKVPALKQVLMLDACASGKVVDNLMAQKDIESSTLRALDRMRDRTGMHIITGCTADAVSYEASKYGQGVLTYSLLEGIRGAALREDQYVDINKLFQYAQDRVPQLAEGIGGIQSPQVFSPQGSQSFDIGLLTDVEKKEIPIAQIRPVYIRSNFQDENELEDVLSIGKTVDESLNEVSSKGTNAMLIFVDVREYPDACRLMGRYKKENGMIVLKLRKRCGAEDRTYDIKAPNIESLKTEILKLL